MKGLAMVKTITYRRNGGEHNITVCLVDGKQEVIDVSAMHVKDRITLVQTLRSQPRI